MLIIKHSWIFELKFYENAYNINHKIYKFVLEYKSLKFLYFIVPKYFDGSKLRTFQGSFQDRFSFYMVFYGKFHNVDEPKMYHTYVASCDT